MAPHKQSQDLQRRAATVPAVLLSTSRTPNSTRKTQAEVDTIFSHANAKVVSLVALSDQTYSIRSSSRDTNGPWRSHFERTIALGTLRLFRAPGSVVFLSCGSALQPIFPRSQCWSIAEDGSKFILQIRPPSYWRIELAAPKDSNPNDGDSLRRCLESVLLLDKTPCSFKESVPISLPPESLSVKKRRPWKPLRSYPSEPILSTESEDMAPADHGPLNDTFSEEFLGEESIAEHTGGSDEETTGTPKFSRDVYLPEANKLITGSSQSGANDADQKQLLAEGGNALSQAANPQPSTGEQLGSVETTSHGPGFLVVQPVLHGAITTKPEPEPDLSANMVVARRSRGGRHQDTEPPQVPAQRKEFNNATFDTPGPDVMAIGKILSKTLLLLFYALCGIFVLAWKGVRKARKPG